MKIVAQRTVVQVGEIKLNLFRLSDGRYRLSADACERAIDATERDMKTFLNSKSPEALPFKTFKGELFTVKGESTRIREIPVEFAMAYWTTAARKGNLKARFLLESIGKNPIPPFEQYGGTYVIYSKPEDKKSPIRTEASYVELLQKEFGGEKEVATKAGSIDLLTSTQLIEVKKVKGWKGALGQVEVYGHYYPSHQKRIHLFGPCHESYLQLVREHCDKKQIVVTWEP